MGFDIKQFSHDVGVEVVRRQFLSTGESEAAFDFHLANHPAWSTTIENIAQVVSDALDRAKKNGDFSFNLSCPPDEAVSKISHREPFQFSNIESAPAPLPDQAADVSVEGTLPAPPQNDQK